MPVSCFLVEHPLGPVLFDAGQTAEATRPGYLPRWHPFMRLSRFELGPEDESGAQVRRLGHDPAAIRAVVLSHLHTDHVGGLSHFPAATVLVTRVEWRRATGLEGRVRGYLPQHWPNGLEPALVDFDGPPVGPFSGSYDVVQDGSLLMVPLPGHTPGHAGLLVDDGARRWLLAGDAAPTAERLAETAPAVAAWAGSNGVTVLTAHDRHDGTGPG